MKQSTSTLIALVFVIVGASLFYGLSIFHWPLNFLQSNFSPAASIQNTRELPNQEIPDHPLTIPAISSAQLDVSSLEIIETVSEEKTYTSYIAVFTVDGLKEQGLLTIPNETNPEKGFPAIVFLHGYIPPNQYKTTQKYVDYVDALAKEGFVVFKIDYRGHGQSEGEPSGAYFSPDYVYDTRAAARALQSIDSVDPDRIGVWGHSMSGNVALRSLVADPTFKAGSIWAGAVFSYTDFIEYGLNDSSYVRNSSTSTKSRSRAQSIFEEFGEISKDSDFWQKVAPTTYLNTLKSPVQLHHALNDNVVSIQYSEDLSEKLQEAGVKHEFYIYQSGGHNIEGSSFVTAMDRTVQFFKKEL